MNENGNYPFVVNDRVRFRDLDDTGHVNNSVYATWAEQARIGVLGHGAPFILARIEVDFRDRSYFGEEIEVRTRCARIGTKSVELEHRIYADGRLVAEAKSVVAGFDAERGESIRVPDEWREKLAL